MSVELKQLLKELKQLDAQFDDAFNTYIYATSKPRPAHYKRRIGPIVSRDSKTQELYRKCVALVKTLTDEQAAQFQQLVDEAVSNDCTNNAQFYQDLKIVLKILEDLTNNENMEEVPIIYLPLYIQIAPLVKKRNSMTKLQNKKSPATDASDTYYAPEETECLSLYTQPNASIKKNHPPRAYTLKPRSIKSQLKRPNELKPASRGSCYQNGKGSKENTKPVKCYQKSAGTRHVDKTDNCRPCRKSVEKDGTRKPNSGINISMKDNEAHKIDKKVTGIERVDEIIEPGLNNKIEIGKKDPKEYRDLANMYKLKPSRLNKREGILNNEDLGGNNKEKLVKNGEENNKEKKINKTECPLEREVLNHACERWLEWVKNFQITCKWNKESKIKEPLTMKSTKEIVNVNNCSQAVISVKKDKNNVFSLYPDFTDYGNIYGIRYHHKNRNGNEKDQDCKWCLESIKDEKRSRVSFKDKERKSLTHTQKSVNISKACGANKVGIGPGKDEHQAFVGFQISAKIGDPCALGKFYLYRVEVKTDKNKASSYYQQPTNITEETIYTIFKWQSKNAKGTPKEQSNYEPYCQNNIGIRDEKDENYKIVLSRWLTIILTFLVLVMISTIRPLGLYIEEIGACDTGYIKETSIRVDIYIKYYKSAKMWYRDRAYNLGYRHQMGINIEEEGYKVIGKSIYVRILISKAMSPGIGISFEFENVLVKVERS
ncbi:hypothetical protein C2G38_2196149 [Gigaspora rosea]|uniref:Uncharacterized protein n=1 Tax=Gigaspora rosea TaxID=44941 RepID=A0A397UXI4_9GLOM|nr:hypothetical protein C2G38_2196149 [Gigaspora rosea]